MEKAEINKDKLITELQERIKNLEKDLESERKILFHTLDIEKVHISEIEKRDKLLERAKQEMLSWCDRNQCDADDIHEWMKQVEELKEGK